MNALDRARDLIPSLEEIARAVAAFLPRLAIAAAILALGWLLGALGRRTTRALLGRLVQRLSRNGRGAFIERHVTDLVGSIVFWGVVFVAAMFATETLGLPVVTTWLGALTAYLPRILVAAGVVIGSLLLGRFLDGIATRMAASLGVARAERIGTLARSGMIGLGFVVAVQQLGLDVSLVLTVGLVILGGVVIAGALGFGLGSQSVVANVLAMHYVRRTFQPGDRVRVGTISGRVVRTTPVALILEHEGEEIAVPAHQILSQVSHRLRDAD